MSTFFLNFLIIFTKSCKYANTSFLDDLLYGPVDPYRLVSSSSSQTCQNTDQI